MKQFVNKEALKKKNQKNDNVEPTQEQIEARKKRGKPSKKEKIQAKRKIKIEKLRESKTQVQQSLAAAQSSTKSVGRFDRKAHKEEKEHKVKRRKEYTHFGSIDQELARNKQIFDLIKQSGMKKLQHTL